MRPHACSVKMKAKYAALAFTVHAENAGLPDNKVLHGSLAKIKIFSGGGGWAGKKPGLRGCSHGCRSWQECVSYLKFRYQFSCVHMNIL